MVSWLALLSVTAGADPALDAAREAERIQREQRLRIEQEQRELRDRQPHTVIEVAPPTAPPAARDGEQHCREVQTVLLDGVTLLGQRERERVIAPYAGNCLSVIDIEQLLSDLTRAYIEHGYISARAYIPAQDLTTGLLRVLVVEGQLEGVRLEDDGQRSVNLATAFPRRVGKPLNLRDFEQGLDQLNRLGSNQATLDVLPGAEAGGSEVVIRNQPTRRWRGGVSYDNYGSSSTGRQQAGANISLDNPLGLNDGLNLSYRRTVNSDFDARHSQSWSLFYAVPLGYFTFTAAYSKSDYATTLSLPGGDLLADGDQDNLSLTTDWLVYRDATQRITFSGTLTQKESRNYLAGQLLDVSSRKLTTLDIGASYSGALAGGNLSARAGHGRGLTWFGALQDEAGRPSVLPQAQFSNWRATLSWGRGFSLFSRTFLFSSMAEAQLSDDVLYGSEQFSIGSLYNVRGYRDSSLSGDEGYYWRNELSLLHSQVLFGQRLNLRPFIGFDTGEILTHRQMPGGHLSSVSIGINAYSQWLSLELVGSKPLSVPDRLEDEGFQGFAKISLML